MESLELLLTTILLGPVKELVVSMRRSKTLTIMVVMALLSLIGFTMFLVKMAGLVQ